MAMGNEGKAERLGSLEFIIIPGFFRAAGSPGMPPDSAATVFRVICFDWAMGET